MSLFFFLAEAYEDGTNVAEQFFSKIMQDTLTHISWPCRLKLAAKTKKDPHVRIVGMSRLISSWSGFDKFFTISLFRS